MYCSSCGKENNKKVCGSCGVKQGKTHKYCIWCGNELQNKADTCINCHEKTKKNIIVSIAVLVFDVILMFLFFMHLFDNEEYRTFLLYPFSILGLVISLPVWRSVINKKTHDNRKMRKPIQIGRYAVVFILIAIITNAIIPLGKYNVAVKTAETDPVEARNLFVALGDYKDAENKTVEMSDIILKHAKSALNSNNWREAEELLDHIPDHNGVDEVKTEMLYQKGVDALENYKYALAKHCFEEISDYRDVNELKKNIGIGLAGNDYNYTSTSYHPVQVSSYSFFFDDNWHKEDSPATVRNLVIHTPKIYVLDKDLDVDATYQYRVVNSTMYMTAATVKPPENPEDWVSAEKMSNIVWEGDKIVSFKLDSMTYTIQ